MLNDVTMAMEGDWLNLSLAQQSVWLDAKLSGASVYQLGGWARVAGPLDEAAVRQSVRLLMARHDALRLRVDDTLPRQRLDDGSGEPPIAFSDLPCGEDADAAFRAHLEHAFAAAMPLGDEPLFRIDVLRAGANLHYVLWRFHHLIADSISVSMTLGYWFEAYDALTSNMPGELSPASSYGRTIAADATYLESAGYHQNLAYWATRFDPMPPPLIADLSAAPSSSASGVTPVSEWTLDGEQCSGLEQAAQAAGTTMQRALFALFAATLGRRHGQTDVVAGVALHRRDSSNRRTLGMMAGVIAVRCDFDPLWSLEECVQAFSEQVDADLRHQRLPIDVLSRALGLSGTGRAGLFEVAMSYLPAGRAEAGSPIEGLPVATGVVATKEASPISLHVTELAGGAGVSVRIAVNTDFLGAGEAATLGSLLRTACGLFVAGRDTRFEDLDPVSAEERRLVVEQWSHGEKPFALNRLDSLGKKTLDALFRVQAAKTPDAIAMVGLDGEEWTYAELDARSTHLARQLAAGGVQPERVVGVRMARSAETIIAILAILKAGGAYLPLDPAYPAERLDYMACDADAMLVLDSIDLLGLPEGHEAVLPDLPEFADPDRLAYVIYTSGTTGLPKGVAVAHAAAVNLAYARRACHDPLASGDRVLAAISVGFDVSIGQLLLPLLAGATVVIAGELKTMDAVEFWALLRDRRVTHINSVPSFFDSVLDAVPAADTLALKRLMLGGEALPGALVGRIHKALPGVEVVNMYGPTEACIDATFHVAAQADLAAAVLPIGRPLSNYRALILHAELAPVGIGVTGELYLGGPGLARGYVNAPELTAERFIADPFADTHGLRLYRTGDRARWRADGCIEFLGRGDAQVKIRGFRVEPDEIAAVLLGHPAIAQAVVVPVAANAAKAGGPLRLVAYLVARSGVVAEAASLRTYLAQTLPEYMIPASFVTVSTIPLNRNGKLDVSALPSPDLASGEYIEPATTTEATVAALFADVLGLGRCSADAHFFELGGHSLLATTLVSKLRDHGWTVPLRAIFETPTVQMLSRRIDASPPAARDKGPIAPYERPEEIPLSSAQERIWFVDRLQQDASYNIPIAFALHGRLDLPAVEQAIGRIIDRHEVLRTSIVMAGGRPMQQILAGGSLPLRRIDLTRLDQQDRAAALASSLAELAAYRFDLAAEQPVSLRLIALAPDHCVLAAVVHHVAFDGWSAGIFLREFAALYNALAARQKDSLPKLALQYADFALWQRQQDHTADIAFWLDELNGAPGLLDLPHGGLSEGLREEPTRQETRRPAGTFSFQIDPTLHAGLLRLASGAGASLFMVLHAAFALLLARLSGSEDVVLGTVVANRGRSEFEPLIGCFVNTLPLRTRFQAGESFASLLGRVRSADLAAYAHQQVPFEQVVEALGPERSLDHTPIFQVLLVLQNAPLDVAYLPGLTLEPVVIEAQAAKFDLTLSIADDAGALTGTFEFARNRFAAEFIASLAGRFQRVLGTVTGNPQLDALAMDILEPVERARVIEEWNRTDTPFVLGTVLDTVLGTLDEMFSAQAVATPEVCAVVGVDGQELSYALLDARSTSVARRLADRGIRPGEVVGVRMERSTETIVALLGILKAGGIYLPLDPAYPADRLDYMAKDAGAVLVLDSLDGFADGGASGKDSLPIDSDPSRLAYIIYTSGTTGLPKGVAVSHRAAVNLAHARRAAHDPLSVEDRVLAAISVGFDVSIGQLLLPLLCGATVVIAGDLKTMGASAFWSLLRQRKITHINTVPSFFASMLDAAPSPGSLRLKRLMLGGEALNGALVASIERAIPGLEVFNMYGPTEACIDATFYRATAADHALPVLPIGRPLPNYRTYILDRRMQPVAPGATGELYLGGEGLAQGYVNAPALTAERFVANPFSSNAGSRLYRTGDRARWRADGVIEFLGRADDQVKIRGFRVEPGEVDAMLRHQPGVREAAVIAQATEAGTRLLAYYTGEAAETTPDALRTALAAALPDYMVPAAFIHLDHLPLSVNGKLDRKALPDPGQKAFAARMYEAPAGEVEHAMAELWAGLLQVERVGRHDNFFALGGHSLLAVTLMERIHQQGLPGDVRTLFTTPTIAGLAAGSHAAAQEDVPANGIVEGCGAIAPEMLPLVTLSQAEIDSIVERVPGGAKNVQDIYPLAPLQEGILFQHRMAAKGDPYLTPFLLGFDTRILLDDFVAALTRLLARHDVLRTAFLWQQLSAPVQVVLRHAALPVEELTFDASTVDVPAHLLSRYDPRRFRLDLSQAPLLRVVIAEDHASGRPMLLLLTHHLILDHTSLEILIHELRTLMRNAQAALPTPLPYRNFIAQTKRTGEEDHEAFFRHLLGDVDEPTAPFGVIDTQAANDATIEENLVLDSALASAIRKRAKALGVTPASLFHLAWAAVLGHVSSKTDVIFGTVLFGRMRSAAGADRVVGMFINTLPIRLRLDDTGLAESVMNTHRLLAQLMTHEHAPLALAQRASAVQAPTPLFSSLFNYRYSADREAETGWPGVRMVHAAERTNYPLAMAIDDSGSNFTLTALTQAGIDPRQVCLYLQQALAELIRLLHHAPTTSIGALQILPPAERSLLVDAWNATEADYGDGTLNGLFRAQAQATPDVIAVVDENGSELSYAELDRRSTRLARQLIVRGVVGQRVVGVRMERSASTILAMLGILKAGAIYLPLDPAYPADRLQFMAADAEAALILDSLEEFDLETHTIEESPVPDDPLGPDRLAYIIYTSGTTGLPKGVAVEHRAAVNLAFARRAAHDPLGPGDRVLAAISVGFDVSIGQLLLPLLAGATVVIAGDLKTMGASAFWAFLQDRRVTHINSVPSLLDSMLDAAPSAGSLALKRLMLGGEALTGALAARIERALPGLEVVNMYGPTETCIDATFHIATPADHDAAVLPIGRPLPNYRAYVLNRRMQPAGIGVEGELYLGGAGVARGYVNAAELTGERFVVDPFSSTPGARLYRTGDLARRRADGEIEFLGRVDSQVKIRGFRVEPGEIEAQLLRQNGIREVAVVPGTANGSTSLIAFYTGDRAPASSDLRKALAAALPDYMIPAAFVKLQSLPLTANGKLDRNALPAPGQDAFAAHRYEAPIGEIEHRLAALWAELLDIDRIGRHDNFFELGGHSLLAVTLIERMRRQHLPGDVLALFTTPTIAGLAALEASPHAECDVPENGITPGSTAITPEMLPLVALTQQQIDRIVASVPGGAANVQDIYPLAPLQEGILFQHLVAAQGDPYLSPLLLGFDQRDRLDGFLQALGMLVERHDVLRTAMIWNDVGEPVQIVLRDVELPVQQVTLDPSSSGAEQLLARFDPLTYRLDLTEAPLLRAVVAQDEPNRRWLLLLLTHHLILDHTSLEILVEELRTLVANPRTALSPAVPYRNFIAQTRQGVAATDHKAFFKRMLGDVDAPTAPFGMLALEADEAETGKTSEGRLTLTPALATSIRERASAMGVTPASLFHLAWAAVLGHVCGKSDVVFGTVLFGRMRSAAGADRVVGMFINTLPIRLRLDDAGIAASVLHTHQLLAELLSHEHAPLALAQRASAVPVSAPLFSSLFNYRYNRPPGDGAAWSGVHVLRAAESTNYPLAMAVEDFATGFGLIALAHASIDPIRICNYLEHALTDLVALLDHAPETPMHALSVLPPVERAAVLEEFNQTTAPFAKGTLHDLFTAQARRTPNAVAVVGVDQAELTYAQLDARSTTLARHLVALGVSPGNVVGVRMERSAETIVALIAILKAGGVYLPLDPAYPADRLAYMASDAGADLVLESSDLPSDHRHADLPELPHPVDPDSLAYGIYTSGTTGLPKGVAVAHSAAVNLAFARRAAHDPIGPGDRVLAAISVGFDVSIGQLLLPLLAGATVVVAGEIKTMSAAEFWALLADREVTHINSVPSFLDSILDAAPRIGSLRLKRLMLGGEALAGALVARIHRAIPGVEVVNMYGPTEACIDATFHRATEADYRAPVLPIGRPLPNTTAYILDRRLHPVGIGVDGELYLGGDGLARGYINSPDLTADRFIPNPFSTAPGARLYRTGDRARRRADGAIEFLGRADNQVKIRGFRVEPGEIEAQLKKQPGVREAVVVPQTVAGATRLVAFYTGRHAAPVQDLRAAIAAALPDYMVPAGFIHMDRLPLSLNGKLDRAALPALAQDSLAAQPYQAPVGQDEEKMASLWAEMLQLDQVGRHDNFFELGGDSLGAMRLAGAVSAAFQVTTPVRSLFQHPTVEALTAAIFADLPDKHSRNLVPLRAGGTRPRLFFLHGLTGHVFHYMAIVRALGPDQPVYGLQASGLEEGEVLAESVEQMAARYVDAIQTLQPHGPYHLLGYSAGGLLAFAMAQRFKELGEPVHFLGLLDTSLPDPSMERDVPDDILGREMADTLGLADLLIDADSNPTLERLVAIARNSGRLPDDLQTIHLERMAAVFRNIVRTCPDYRVRPWEGAMLLVRAISRAIEPGRPPDDWSPYVRGPLHLVDCDCTHLGLVTAQMAPAVASAISLALTAERVHSSLAYV